MNSATHQPLFAFPDADSLAALRAWHAGMSSRAVVTQYLDADRIQGQSSRGIVGGIRRQLAAYARYRRREDLAVLFEFAAADRSARAREADQAIETLRTMPPAVPAIADDIGMWLSPGSVAALRAQDLHTLADLAVRIPRRRQWWATIPGLGVSGAKRIEAFFKNWPDLTVRAQALVAVEPRGMIVPWEQIGRLPHEVDGSLGQFRAPRETSSLSADNDYAAVQAWLALHESPSTQRAYRKEAERLILWAIIEKDRPLSSLTTEDATAYRNFLREPSPRERWVGPARPRSAADWKPFTDGLSPRSAAYALQVIGALFRWLVQQRYVLANPFAGLKVRGGAKTAALDVSHAFSEGEWMITRSIADGLEWSYGWDAAAAQRLRFILDFTYATGLRASELVGATLRSIETDVHGDHWLHLVGKGAKAGRVALPPLARNALDHYLVERQLPVTRALWEPATPLVGNLGLDESGGITGARLWMVMKRFFATAADQLEAERPATAEKLRKASPHWLRHTHATHALARGAELITVRDNLRHASVSTTSLYLHGDSIKRARQMEDAFGA
ncbi:Tyrosine recombinase XerC [Cupriavidus campinensis]|uniref:Integrase n=1 Tax=Cupriavidus campinensis TaxID=151783 RepID=A0ABY3EJJ8_9BURK|nr:site-specific integrase [Cupriavidus campinensis]TSP11029.1 integrase [Cupriavidus campinensis]CAG2138080.1 Tyrosine recombinase XerC [Cupriavidus campinensis]